MAHQIKSLPTKTRTKVQFPEHTCKHILRHVNTHAYKIIQEVKRHKVERSGLGECGWADAGRMRDRYNHIALYIKFSKRNKTLKSHITLFNLKES